MSAISVKKLSFSYPCLQADTAAAAERAAQEQARLVLRDVSFELAAGDFALLCGYTGSGKTTLLRHLVPALTPQGTRTGQLTVKGSVGFVQQDPDNQIVTDLVFHELAFALENQGMPTATIRRRVAEVASYFGLEYLLESPTHTLSGGQKQILNLAAAMVCAPDILVLDEPTAELDPIAAQKFFRHLQRLNKELGTTVLCCEHRLDEVLTLCDQVLLLDNQGDKHQAAESVQTFTPQELITYCAHTDTQLTLFLPEATQVAIACESSERKAQRTNWPLDVRSGRAWLKEYRSKMGQSDHLFPFTAAQPPCAAQSAIVLRDLCFRYSKHEPYVLTHLSAEFAQGQIHAIVGGNASGKSTLLALICGLLKPQLGQVRINKQAGLAALPQNPKASFLHDTLLEDLLDAYAGSDPAAARQMAQRLQLDQLLDRHPFDLSGGEMQKAALAKLLLTDPDIILLDEPTKGLDARAKQEMGQIFTQLAQAGTTLIIVTHDLPFAARYTHSCSLLAAGQIIASDQTQNFFAGNSFYTTPTNRMAKHILPHCVTVPDLVDALTPPPTPVTAEEGA